MSEGPIAAWQEHVDQIVHDRLMVEAMWLEDQLREAYELHEGSELALITVDQGSFTLGDRYHPATWPTRSVASLWPMYHSEADYGVGRKGRRVEL